MATTPRIDLLGRSVLVLEALAGMEQPTTLPALARRTGAPTSQIYRVLRVLEHHGFVDHVGRRGYRLGSRALGLGVLLGPRPDLWAIAHPVLGRLAAATSIMARLHVRSGHDRVLLLVALPSQERAAPASVQVGERAPLTRGCSGRAILAHLPPDEIVAAVLARPVDDEAHLHDDLRGIRRDGHAVSLAANHAGRRGVAVPVHVDGEPGPLGAVSLSADTGTGDEATLKAFTPRLARAATELGALLSARFGPEADSSSPALDLAPPR